MEIHVGKMDVKFLIILLCLRSGMKTKRGAALSSATKHSTPPLTLGSLCLLATFCYLQRKAGKNTY